MARTKKRKRTVIRWDRILWPLVVVIGAIGWYVSTATSLTSVRVEGAKLEDRARIKEILAEVKNVPFSRLNGANTESLVSDLPGVRSAQLSRTFFGRGTLTVKYVTPVARITDGQSYLLGEDGSYFVDRGETDLIEVRVNPALGFSPTGLINAFDSETVMKVLAEVKARFSGREYHLEIPAVNRFEFVVQDCVIELGDMTKLGEKFASLDEQIRLHPDLLTSSSRFVVTNPIHPAALPRTNVKSSLNDVANGSQNPPN